MRMKGSKLHTNRNLFININDNTALIIFCINNMHQKEPLGCVVYSHCPTNDSYNKSIHSCWWLPCNYVTKPFGILQRVMKSVYIIWTQQKSIPFLSEKFAAKLSELF